MSKSPFSIVAAVAVLLLCPPATAAQQRPTPQQAQLLIGSRPDLIAQLRDRIIKSGMSPDQVRARLRAEGYPDSLLDPYLSDAPGTQPDSIAQDVLDAVQLLGVPDDSTTEATSRSSARRPPARRAVAGAWLSHPDSTTETVLFGLGVFQATTSQFDPNLAGPVDANYRVGPGDRLALLLSGQVEAAYTLDVTREGFVVVPQVGRIDVANLTMAQMENLFFDRLGRVYSEIRRGPEARTHFSISPVRLRTNQIYVVGDVAQPGSYRISAAGTVLSALYAAGGPTETGTLRNVEVRRAGRVAAAMDVYDYLLRGDASKDSRLENGDVVFVGIRGSSVQIAGEVLRPAIYELKAGETLADLIRSAGGFSASASRRRIQIERLSPAEPSRDAGRERSVIDVASLPGGLVPATALQNGDLVRVYAITDRVRNSVSVRGNVWAPGRVAFTPGMTLSVALQRVGGVRPDVYLGQIVISRLQSDSTRVRVYSAFGDSLGTLIRDLPLQEDDEVQIFSTTEFRQERFVSIDGAVNKPGQYAYREAMTLRDLVLQAGGLHERALLTEAELARMPADRTAGQLAVLSRVPIDSTYVFERAADGKYLGPPGVAASMAKAQEVTLRAYDAVLILEQPDWDLPRHVTIIGEVHAPGTYALASKQERLSDLVKRAGGLSERAYPEGVSFYRKADRVGRIGINLPRVIGNPGFRDNLQLQDGDSILVPPYRATVVVAGFVNSPVAVAYVPGKTVDWYIRAAGGPAQKADIGRAWVVQPNGSVESGRKRWFLPDFRPRPQPGASVTVPQKDTSDKKDTAQIVGAVAQVLASLVTIVVVTSR